MRGWQVYEVMNQISIDGRIISAGARVLADGSNVLWNGSIVEVGQINLALVNTETGSVEVRESARADQYQEAPRK